MDFSKLEQKIFYTFKDKKLLQRALTLASHDNNFNNQTLEFLGDAVLEFIVSDKIYDQSRSEGELTELRKDIVSDAALEPVSRRLGLDSCLKGYEKNNKKAVPSAYEAIVAAIYLDGGIEAAKSFILKTLDFTPKKGTDNFKGALQEALQSRGENLPEYKTKNIGTPQSPRFKSVVRVFGNEFSGEGENKQAAEQSAARRAIKRFKING